MEDKNEFLPAIQTQRNKPLWIRLRRKRGCVVRRNSVKALHERGLQRQRRRKILHQALKNEFSRLQTVGVKIDTDSLRQTATLLVRDDTTVPVTEQIVIESTGKELHEAILFNFVYDFCQ